MNTKKTIVLLFAAAALAGCNTFTPSQTSSFADEDGHIVSVTYGTLKKEHRTEFVSPVDGRKIDMKSKLAVGVKLPDGGQWRAYQCMNMLPTGTMYKTDDGKWLFHANGTTCSVYLIDESHRDYILVFDGTLSGGIGSSRTNGSGAK